MDDGDILKTLQAHPDDLEGGCRALIAEANERGGDDNVTVVLVRAAARSSSAN